MRREVEEFLSRMPVTRASLEYRKYLYHLMAKITEYEEKIKLQEERIKRLEDALMTLALEKKTTEKTKMGGD
jgi:hypothetical protein